MTFGNTPLMMDPAPAAETGGQDARAANATEAIWTDLEHARQEVETARRAFEAVEARLPEELRLDRVLAMLGTAPKAKLLELEEARARAGAREPLERLEAAEAALDALEDRLVSCPTATAVDVARKLDLLPGHVRAEASDRSMQIVRQARRDLYRLAARRPLAAPAEPVEDPAVNAFERWRQARQAELEYYRKRPEGGWENDPGFLAAEQAAIEAERALANAVATTPAGLAAQIRFAFRVFGELKPGRLGIEPDDYAELGGLEGGGGAELLRNLLAGAERLAPRPGDKVA